MKTNSIATEYYAFFKINFLCIKLLKMKTVGLIGGMSWESSVVYYQIINKKVNELLGGFHSCKSVMCSVDFAEIEKLQHEDKWDELNDIMVQSAKQLERAGADFIVLCTNTMHLSSSEIVKNITIPFLHIAEAVGDEILKKGLKKVGLLGTRFTMEKDFYKSVIQQKFGVEVIVPNKVDRNTVHSVIFDELVHGKINNESREKYKEIICKLQDQGAQGIILGCTEIPLLISDTDINLPTFNTTRIHAEKAVEWAVLK